MRDLKLLKSLYQVTLDIGEEAIDSPIFREKYKKKFKKRINSPNSILSRQLEHWREVERTTNVRSDLFKRMAMSATNSYGKPSVIGGAKDTERADRIEKILCQVTHNFDPNLVAGLNKTNLKKAIKKSRTEVNKHLIKTKSKTNKSKLVKSTKTTKKKKTDKIISDLARGLINAATYCLEFKDANEFRNRFRISTSHNDITAFDEFDVFDNIMALSDEIHGIALALSCDIFKEVGLWEYGKPDTHVMDILPYFTNNIYKKVSSKKPSQEAFHQCLLDLLRVSKLLEIRPYEFDKLIYVISSGSFHTFGVELSGTTWKRELRNRLNDALIEGGVKVPNAIHKIV